MKFSVIYSVDVPEGVEILDHAPPRLDLWEETEDDQQYYHLAWQYAERYNSRYGNGLIPESAPMMEDIAEFWGRHFLGRGWRKRLTE